MLTAPTFFSKGRTAGLLASALLCATAVSSAVAQSCPFKDLGVLPGQSFSAAYGVNNNNFITGESGSRGFITHGGTMKDLGTLGGTSTYPFGINQSDQVAGFSTTAAGDFHAFLYDQGVMRDLGTLGGASSYAFALNDSGEVVGQAQTASGAFHAFLYRNNHMVDLGTLPGGTSSIAYAVSNTGHIAGSSYLADGTFHAFVRKNGVLVDIGTGPGLVDSEAYAIDDNGEAAGYSQSADGTKVRGFVYKQGMLSNLGDLGGDQTYATGINSAGFITGYSMLGDTQFHAFYSVPKVMIDLGTFKGGVSSQAEALNDQGKIVGSGTTSAGATHAFVCQLREDKKYD